MSANEEFGAALDRLIPKTLDSVITLHRDHAELRFSTTDDLAPLCASVSDDGTAQDISRWSLITFDWHKPGVARQAFTVLFGDHLEKGSGYHTSPIQKLDQSTKCVRTRSGTLYRMRGSESHEPDLLRVCNWVCKTGTGKYLGVLPIFY